MKYFQRCYLIGTRDFQFLRVHITWALCDIDVGKEFYCDSGESYCSST